jgi:hypothetical protein
MTQGWFDALSEQKFFDQYQANEAANTRYKAGATPEISARVGQIYSQSPWMTPGQVLALAKGNASPQAVELASQTQAKRVPALLDPNKPDNKSFFERNVYDKVKETTRWSFAALDTIKDLSQNVASQVFNPGDPAGFDGWFQSTSLGTMLSDSEQAGEGFFLGGTSLLAYLVFQLRNTTCQLMPIPYESHLIQEMSHLQKKHPQVVVKMGAYLGQ